MRIAFMGTPDFAVPTLEALAAAGHDIAAVYTQPPRRAGRGKALQPSPVHRRAEALGLEVRHPLTLRDADEQAAFAAENGIQFPLVSDADLELATALRLPTFRHSGATRLKRLTLVVDADRVVRGTLFPIRDVTGSVEDALALVRSLS